MSLDITIGTPPMDAVGEADAVAAQAAAPATRFWLQDLAMIAGTGFGVLFASALSVLLFLR